jgi:hypothetical protein
MIDRHEIREIAVSVGWFAFAAVILVGAALLAASVS